MRSSVSSKRTKALEEAENIWLRALDNELDAAELGAVLSASYAAEKQEAYTRYIQPLMKANIAILKEVRRMGTAVDFVSFMTEWIKEDPSLVKSLGVIPYSEFEAERQRAEAESVALRERVRILEQTLREQAGQKDN
jgi:hypothetical protein